MSPLALRHRNNGRAQVDELELHLLRCRRREEPAWVMVAHVSAGARAADLLAQLRLTDTARAGTNGHANEVVCVLDAHGLDRDALEDRLRATLPAADLRFGWAHFPDDGAGLHALVDEARLGATT